MFNVRRYIFFLKFFLLFGFAFIAQTKSTNVQTIDGKKYYIHKIEKSQSLYAISKIYGVGLDDIYRSNPELKNGAKANQEIRIPFTTSAPVTNTVASSSPAVAPPDTSKYITYKVSKGETLYSLMKKFNLSDKQLLTYNPVLTTGVKEGQMLIVGEKSKKKNFAIKESKETKPVFTASPRPTNLITDSSLYRPVLKPRKQIYSVALILPFRLENTLAMDMNELVKNNMNFPAVPALAVDFYLGFRKAIDSLKAKDFDVKLEVYDIDDKDSVKLNQIVNSPSFKELDLVFGPLYANGFKTIARRARELAIPVVSPITQQNKILYNNIYISKTNPSQFTLMESLADYCIDSLVNNNANIILMLLSDKDRKEIAFVNAFKKYYNERQKSLGKEIKDTVTIAKGLNALKLVYKPGVKNIIITLSNNQVFVTDFTTQLSIFADKKEILLGGWQSIAEMDNIDQEYLEQLHYFFPHQYNITNERAFATAVDQYHKSQETYPGEYFFVGHDVAFYYLKNLKEIGPDFVYTLNNLPYETNYLRFKYARPDTQTGFDNRGVYLFRYQNYQIIKTGWK
jgi:LysM repeat protein